MVVEFVLQRIGNWGMGDHLGSTMVPLVHENTTTFKLWDKPNTSLKMALTAKLTGGQAFVIIRQNDSSQIVLKWMKEHCDSDSNKSAIFDLIMG